MEYEKALEVDPDNRSYQHRAAASHAGSIPRTFREGQEPARRARTSHRATEQLRLAQLAATELS